MAEIVTVVQRGNAAELSSFLAGLAAPPGAFAIKRALAIAAQSGRTDLLDLLAPLSTPDTILNVVLPHGADNVAVFDWLHAQGHKIYLLGCVFYATSKPPTLAVIDWFLKHNCLDSKIVDSALSHALAAGDTAMLDWLDAHDLLDLTSSNLLPSPPAALALRWLIDRNRFSVRSCMLLIECFEGELASGRHFGPFERRAITPDERADRLAALHVMADLFPDDHVSDCSTFACILLRRRHGRSLAFLVLAARRRRRRAPRLPPELWNHVAELFTLN